MYFGVLGKWIPWLNSHKVDGRTPAMSVRQGEREGAVLPVKSVLSLQRVSPEAST